MERTVPNTESDEVELYLRTYYSLLRSSSDVEIRTLETVHAGVNSLLHPLASSTKSDMSAFIYSLLRLPEMIFNIRQVVLGQGSVVFKREGYGDVENWQMVSALARRRRYFFDGKETLATFIVSRSDIDDIIPLLTAFQLEWNKLHVALRNYVRSHSLDSSPPVLTQTLADFLNMELDDLLRLQTLWGDQFQERLKQIAEVECKLRIRSLSGSLSQYRRATDDWWDRIEQAVPEILESPVYFVSSNTHSLVNIISGFAIRNKQSLLTLLEQSEDELLKAEWEDIQRRNVPSSMENFIYYLLKKFNLHPSGKHLKEMRAEQEKSCGIVRVQGGESFDIQAQVIPFRCIDPAQIDGRLDLTESSTLLNQDAFILNIDYPLGMAAYHILAKVASRVQEVRGVYIMGKAATLNGVVGDVMIPNVVHDEQSKNTYLFPNSLYASDVSPYLVYGTVLDNQKAVTVRGTFLQTAEFMDIFYREGYTDIEMEAGPYLSAIYEMHRPKRHPYNEIVNLYGIPFDFGIAHYASDQPLSKGKNLGAGSLSYFGVDPTYAVTLAILKRIFNVERSFMKGAK